MKVREFIAYLDFTRNASDFSYISWLVKYDCHFYHL